MNLLIYRDQLLKVTSPSDPLCPMNLRIKPSLRYIILKEHHDYNWLVNNEYSADQRTSDVIWSNRHEKSILQERAKVEKQVGILKPKQSPWVDYKDKNLDRLSGLTFYPGFYKPDIFASYQVGPPRMPWGKDRGYTFKVFFEFKNPQEDLSPNIYKEFSRRLSETSFEGDSKIPMSPGWIRFAWNNVIVHATSIESAKIAERVGLEFFGPHLASYSRGVDVRSEVEPFEISDWPHFLCEGDPSGLPKDVFDFVQN